MSQLCARLLEKRGRICFAIRQFRTQSHHESLQSRNKFDVKSDNMSAVQLDFGLRFRAQYLQYAAQNTSHAQCSVFLRRFLVLISFSSTECLPLPAIFDDVLLALAGATASRFWLRRSERVARRVLNSENSRVRIDATAYAGELFRATQRLT